MCDSIADAEELVPALLGMARYHCSRGDVRTVWSWWGLLRRSRSWSRPRRTRAGRYFREGNCCGAAHGKFAGQPTKPLCAGARRSAAVFVVDEATALDGFATLSFATYDNVTHRFTYANCGHNPPLLLRGNGDVHWLNATASVLGRFEEWTCVIEEVKLQERDTLIMFTDGIIEATSEAGEEYMDARLVEIARRRRNTAASALIPHSSTICALLVRGADRRSDARHRAADRVICGARPSRWSLQLFTPSVATQLS